jgi:hypothetical protein
MSQAQILAPLKECKTVKATSDICRSLVVHQAANYKWNKMYSGMYNRELHRLKELEEESPVLTYMYA